MGCKNNIEKEFITRVEMLGFKAFKKLVRKYYKT